MTPDEMTTMLAEVADLEALCELMHDAYEEAAATEGWSTQKASRVPWADVPEANKATMRAAVGALTAHLAAVLAATVTEAQAGALREFENRGARKALLALADDIDPDGYGWTSIRDAERFKTRLRARADSLVDRAERGQG